MWCQGGYLFGVDWFNTRGRWRHVNTWKLSTYTKSTYMTHFTTLCDVFVGTFLYNCVIWNSSSVHPRYLRWSVSKWVSGFKKIKRQRGRSLLFVCVCACFMGGKPSCEWVCAHGATHQPKQSRPALAGTEKTKISGSQVTSAEILEASTATLNTVLLKEANDGEAQVDPKWDYITQRYFHLLILLFHLF